MTNILPPYNKPTEYQSYAYLSNSAIKAIPTTGTVVIPAAGENKLIIPKSCIFYLNIDTAYTVGEEGTLWSIYYATDSYLASGYLIMTEALDGSTPSPIIGSFQFPYIEVGPEGLSPSIANIPGLAAACINSNLILIDLASGVANYTDGSDENYCKVVTTYNILNTETWLFE